MNNFAYVVAIVVAVISMVASNYSSYLRGEAKGLHEAYSYCEQK